MRKNSLSPLKSAWVIDDAGIGFLDLLAGGDEIVPGLDRCRIDAGLLVEVAAVEHGDRAGIPRHRVGLVADLELGALEVGEFRLRSRRCSPASSGRRSSRGTGSRRFSASWFSIDTMSGSPSPPAAQPASVLSKIGWLPRSSTVTFTSGNCLLKPATVAFSDEAAMFQLQIVISPDCAKAGPEPRRKRKRGAGQL